MSLVCNKLWMMLLTQYARQLRPGCRSRYLQVKPHVERLQVRLAVCWLIQRQQGTLSASWLSQHLHARLSAAWLSQHLQVKLSASWLCQHQQRLQ